ncbi:MAG: hypothetical protein RLO48_13495, partial [Bauldia litoralis]
DCARVTTSATGILSFALLAAQTTSPDMTGSTNLQLSVQFASHNSYIGALKFWGANGAMSRADVFGDNSWHRFSSRAA